MLEILQYIFSGFWIFIGTIILLDLIIVNIFKIINNYLKYRCIAKLSNDGKTTEEIEKLLDDKKEKDDDLNED